MDWTQLSSEDLDRFIYSILELPKEDKAKVISNVYASLEDQTFAVDFYLSTLKKVKDLSVFSYQEVLDNIEELYDWLGVPELTQDRIINILTLAKKINFKVSMITQNSLKPYQGKTYYLSSLICGQFHYPDNFLKIFQEKDPCTPIGAKIANSLIKAAAQRIFADPYQSILEPIVNSVDAYSDLKVGKFGLGFYSLLYWLVDHPDRYLILESKTKDSHWQLKIWETHKFLVWQLDLLPIIPEAKTGLTVLLDWEDDPVDLESFNSQLFKLKWVRGAKILLNNQELNRETSDNLILVILNTGGLRIQDFATGISLPTLFGSLLVPTISEKKISTSLKIGSVGLNFNSSINKAEENNLLVLVGSIGVINIPFSSPIEDKYSIVLNLSLGVRLPTSRDDIIIDEQSNGEIIAALDQILYNNFKTIVPLEYALEAFSRYTASEANKKFVSDYLEGVSDKIKAKGKILVPYIHESFYKQVDVDLFVTSTNYSLVLLEETLLNFNWPFFSDDIFWGKRVVIMPLKNLISTNGGTSRFVFIDKDWWVSHTNGPVDLTLANTDDFFVPIVLEWGQNISEDIQQTLDDYKEEFNPNVLSLIANFLLRIRRLKLYYKLELQDYYYDEFFLDTFVFLQNHQGEETMLKFITNYYKVFSVMKPKTGYGNNKQKLIDSHYKYYVLNLESQKLNKYTSDMLFWALDKLYVDKIPTLITVKSYFMPLINYFKFDGPTVLTIADQTTHFIYFTLIILIMGNSIPERLNLIINNCKLIEVILKQEFNLVLLEKVLVDYLFRSDRDLFNVTIFRRILSQLMIMSDYDLANIYFDPLLNPVKISLSSLINLSFKENITPDKFIENISNFKEEAVPNLQLIEVAINENTTKSFWEATIIELVQNSIDAIRLSKKNNRIDVKIGINGDEIYFSFQDYVGIPPSAYPALMLPFVSSKSSEQLITTGEIGSGFFNVYRRSSEVFIDSCLNGYNVTILDRPVWDSRGRAVDINKEIQLNKNSNKKDFTEIKLKVKSDNSKEEIGLILFKIHSLLGLIDQDIAQITLNNKKIAFKTKIILTDDDFGTIKIADQDKFTSMLLTKSVPFRKLTDIITDLPLFVLSRIENNLIVDLISGYIPVSNRANLNLNKDKKEKIINWIKDGIYTFLLNEYLQHEDNKANEFIPNTTSLYWDNISLLYVDPQNFYEWLTNYKSKIYSYSLVDLFKHILDLLKNGGISKLNDVLQNLTIPEIQMAAIKKWFSNKKDIEDKILSIKTAKFKIEKVKVLKDGIFVEQSNIQGMNILLKSFVNVFWAKGRKLFVEFFDGKETPRISLENIKGAVGLYSKLSNSIYISIDLLNNDFITKIDELLYSGDFMNNWMKISSDNDFEQIFGLRLPASILVHELTHAWSMTSHSVSGHDDVKLMGPEGFKFYSYDEAANIIYKAILTDNFLAELFEEINKTQNILDYIEDFSIVEIKEIANEMDFPPSKLNELIINKILGKKIINWIPKNKTKDEWYAELISKGYDNVNIGLTIYDAIKNNDFEIIAYLNSLELVSLSQLTYIIKMDRFDMFKLLLPKAKDDKLSMNEVVKVSMYFETSKYLDYLYDEGVDFSNIKENMPKYLLNVTNKKNLDWFLEKGLWSEEGDENFEQSFNEKFIENYAFMYLDDNNSEYFNQRLEVFSWLIDHGYKFYPETINSIANDNNVIYDPKSVIFLWDFFSRKGFLPDKRVYDVLTKKYRFNLENVVWLEWLENRGILPDKEDYDKAAAAGLIYLADWINNRGYNK